MDGVNKIEMGKRIRALRTKTGLTMEEFGELFDPKASKSIVSRWENGKSTPSNDRIKRIAEVYNISTYYLLYGKNHSLYSDESINTEDIDRFKSISELLFYFVEKNKITDKEIPNIFSEKGFILDNILLHDSFKNYTDRDVKLLSNKLSDNILEQLMIHYKICKMLGIASDIEKFNEDERYFYSSRLRQAYYILEKHYYQSNN